MLFSTNYIDNLIELPSDERYERMAGIEALNCLILATGVYKLFTRSDYKEFIERLHLLTIQYKLIDQFFLGENELMFFIYKGDILYLELEDVVASVGLMSGSGPRKMEDRRLWLKNSQQRLNDAILAGLDHRLIVFLNDCRLEEVTINGVVGTELVFRNMLKDISAEDFKNADILAESIVKEIPENIFSDWAQKNAAIIKHYDEEMERMEGIPHFEFSELSKEQRKLTDLHFSQFSYPSELNFRLMMQLTHLAWAFANGFVSTDQSGNYMIENFVWLDPDTLHIEGVKMEIGYCIEYYQLKELQGVFNRTELST